jgi:hypothetical protein
VSHLSHLLFFRTLKHLGHPLFISPSPSSPSFLPEWIIRRSHCDLPPTFLAFVYSPTLISRGVIRDVNVQWGTRPRGGGGERGGGAERTRTSQGKGRTSGGVQINFLLPISSIIETCYSTSGLRSPMMQIALTLIKILPAVLYSRSRSEELICDVCNRPVNDIISRTNRHRVCRVSREQKSARGGSAPRRGKAASSLTRRFAARQSSPPIARTAK